MKPPRRITADDVLDALVEYTQEPSGQYRARCPVHLGESETSLHIKEGDDGEAVLHCFADCAYEDILAALGLDNGKPRDHESRARRSKPTQEEKTSDAKPKKLRDVVRAANKEAHIYMNRAGEPVAFHLHKGSWWTFVDTSAEDRGDWLMVTGEPENRPLFKVRNIMIAIQKNDPVVVVEGEKDASMVSDWLGFPGTTSGGADTWRSEYAYDLRDADVVIIPDHDEPGETYARTVAESAYPVAKRVRIVYLVDLMPELKSGGDLTDYKEDGGDKDALLEAIENAPTYEPEDWPEPRPVEVKLPEVMALDEALLPDALAKWVFDSAERMDNTPPDFIGASAIVAAGSLLGRKVGIRPKAKDDWLVIPNLWGALVGMPSSMKTPSLDIVLKPLRQLALEAREEYVKAREEYEQDTMFEKAEREALLAKLKNLKKKGEGLDDIKKELEELGEDADKEPVEVRYETNDATQEKLGEILRDNPNGILNHRDELMGWLRSLDDPQRARDRAFFLEAWNGTASFTVDRIGRGSVFIPALCLSILGGIQPGPLQSYVAGALDGAEQSDGLLQRFQVVVWPDLGEWEPVDKWPNRDAMRAAYAALKGLAHLDPTKFGAVKDEADEQHYVRFTDEGQEVFNSWRASFEPQFRTGENPAAVEAHFIKYRSLFASLALIFEALDHVADGKSRKGVGQESALRAGAWVDYLETHARRLYSLGIETAASAAAALLDHLHAGDVKDGESLRKIWHRGWSGLATADNMNAAVEVLEAHGWVRRETVKPAGGGRPSVKLRLHPELREES